MKTEVAAMAHLEHDHIIRQFDFGTADYVKSSGRVRKDVNYIVLEIAQGGCLFDYVANTGRFSEKAARYYFKQLLAGVGYCHRKGIAHRDIKPENILVDSSLNLKVADFGFAAPTAGRDGSGELKTCLGTAQYMAPEIHLKKPY